MWANGWKNVVPNKGYIGKVSDASRAVDAAGQISDAFPVLREWATAYPQKVLHWADEWPRLLKLVEWVAAHPRSGLYLRQVDIPGIDTKFIETHRSVLGEILDVVLSPESLDEEQSGAAHFEARYGFCTKPQPIRFRYLDPAQSLQGLRDLAVPNDQFACLNLPVRCVFIVENAIEFWAFPAAPASIILFGVGYGLKRFRAVAWLAEKDIYYWGDIDTHGLAILDELRTYFPLARSMLMDAETLLTYRQYWETEDRPATHDLTRLTPPRWIFITDYGRITGAGMCVWSKKKFPCPMWRAICVRLVWLIPDDTVLRQQA